MNATQVDGGPRMLVAALALAVAGGWLGADPEVSCACLPAVTPRWMVEAWEVTDPEDGQAPTAPSEIRAEAEPTVAGASAEGCNGEATCPQNGSLRIVIGRASVDDLTATDEIAYRVEVVEGDASPFPDAPVFAEPGADADADLTLYAPLSEGSFEARLQIIPVDAGGNEGPASDVFRVSTP